MAGADAEVEHIFSFGVISDVQYADREDGFNYLQTQRRYYRGALEGLRRAVASWVGHRTLSTGEGGSQEPRQTFFLLQLGDLLDGFNAPDGSEGALSLLLGELEAAGSQSIHHCIGNHELYNFNRAQLLDKLDCFRLQRRFYYSFSPHPRFRLLNLDAYDVSVLGAEEGTAEHALATAYLSRNPNKDKRSPLNLRGTDRRFVAFNGGIGATQLAWLRQELQGACREGQWVILFHHVPIHPKAAASETLLWNYEEVLGILHEFPNVLASLSGHTHEHAVHKDERGIIHYVLAAPLECPPEVDAFSTAIVYQDRLEIKGYGLNSSITIPYRPFRPGSPEYNANL